MLNEGLESIGIGAFCETGIESVTFPASLRRIRQGAFCGCENLRTAKFSEGLEVLGTDEYGYEDMTNGVFEESGLEDVRLPSTLKMIEHSAFEGCENLRRVQLPDGLTYIRSRCFFRAGLTSVTITSNVVEIGYHAFYRN